jgi:starch-binding outer membrane protein, SusD/RagB family
MKKILYFILVFVFTFTIIISCDKSELNIIPSTELSEAVVWKDPTLVEAYVNDIYRRIPWSFRMTAHLVDESRSRADGDDFNIHNMIINADNAYWGDWSGRYSSIRACNILLENIDKFSIDNEILVDGKSLKEKLTGEVKFLRAWNYHMLVSYFGGVPLIKKSYQLTDDFTIARDSYADCINFIVEECDAAAKLLPEIRTGNDDGRATKGAAMALKSRVLLYAASDLHNTTFSGFSNPELLGYTDDKRMDRWKAAKDAAKAVIDLNIYELYGPSPATQEEAKNNYIDLFILPKTTEDIFVRYFSLNANAGVGMYGLYPNGWYGNASIGLINELVDAYEMFDGTVFSRSNPAQKLEPYKNRDPRFYGTCVYEGAKLRPRPGELAEIDPVGVLQAGQWEKWDETTNSVYNVFGLDTRSSSVYSWNANYTGTTSRKYLNINAEPSAVWQANSDLTWRYFRYAEILLNYSEACIELGEEAEAKTYLNMIRKRAGMPDITDTGLELKARYRNERRIEMVFEDQRFFDVRRWMIGPDAYHAVHGVDIVYKLNPDKTTSSIPIITPIEIMSGSWDDKAYFFPISRDELNKNSKLIQNPGY